MPLLSGLPTVVTRNTDSKNQIIIKMKKGKQLFLFAFFHFMVCSNIYAFVKKHAISDYS